ncbi:MAG: hypothetical protein AB1801_09620, partial [Chloroflexota bacterium]
PQVNPFLTEQVARYQRRQAEKQRQHETALVSQTQQAITLLAASGNHMTQTAIREMIGLSLSQLQMIPPSNCIMKT